MLSVKKLFCKKRSQCDRFGALKTCDGFVYMQGGQRFYECKKFFKLSPKNG